MKKLITTILLVTAIALGGCQKSVIEGKVIDGFGNPVKGATIKVKGTQFTTQTNDNGNYSVGYVPGDISVLISKPGFTDTSFAVTITTESKFPAEASLIYEIPKEVGIFLMQDGVYKALEDGKISVKKYSIGDPWYREERHEVHVSFDEQNVLTVKKVDGNLVFFDNDPNDQFLIRMHKDRYGENVALVRTVRHGRPGFGTWNFKDEIDLVNETYKLFKNKLAIRTSNLDIGDYLFAQFCCRTL